MGIDSPLTHVMGYLLIAIIVVLGIGAIATIAYGMRLRAKRRSADAEVIERGEDVGMQVRPPSGTIPEPGAVPEGSVPTPAPPPPQSEPAPAATADTPSDLTQLKGLGPKVAARLGELGMTRIDQLAALSPAEAEALDAQLGTFSGRMARDRWVEQARLLAAGDRAGFEAAFGKL